MQQDSSRVIIRFMSNKSDHRADRTVSATEASREFKKLLDAVEAGERVLIHRHGKEICLMSPPPVDGRPGSACLEILRGRTPVLLDDEFGRDLLDVIATEPPPGDSPWDS